MKYLEEHINNFEEAMEPEDLKAFNDFFNEIEKFPDIGMEDHEMSPQGLWYYACKYFRNKDKECDRSTKGVY